MLTKDKLFDLLSQVITEQDCWEHDGDAAIKTLMWIAGYNDAMRDIVDEPESEDISHD